MCSYASKSGILAVLFFSFNDSILTLWSTKAKRWVWCGASLTWPLSHSLSPTGQAGEEMTVFVDWNKDREPAHQQPSQQKRPPLGEFIYCQLK